MKLYIQRKAMVEQTLADPDSNVTQKEALVYVYHWVQYELALQKCKRAQRKMNEHRRVLNRSQFIFGFRKNLKNL